MEFVRVLEPLEGPFEKVTDWNVAPAHSAAPRQTGSLLLDRRQNDAVRALNRLARMKDVSIRSTSDRFIVDGRWTADTIADLGVTMRVASVVGGARVTPPRVGLWDQYGGSMPSGWTRWILEQFEFPFTRVFAPELDAGNLNAKYDALIFVNGAIPAAGTQTGRGGRGGAGGGRGGAALAAEEVPAEFRSHVGRISPQATIPQLHAFVEAGGTIIAIGSSAENLAAHLKLPLANHVVENGVPLPRSKYFVPGSVLTTRVDTTHPAAAGMKERTDVFFDNSPVFRLTEPNAPDVRVIATLDTDKPLKSGWAWGQAALKGGIVAAEVRVGKGSVFLYGPEILHRAQPHGTFKLLFNALLLSTTVR